MGFKPVLRKLYILWNKIITRKRITNKRGALA